MLVALATGCTFPNVTFMDFGDGGSTQYDVGTFASRGDAEGGADPPGDAAQSGSSGSSALESGSAEGGLGTPSVPVDASEDVGVGASSGADSAGSGSSGGGSGSSGSSSGRASSSSGVGDSGSGSGGGSGGGASGSGSSAGSGGGSGSSGSDSSGASSSSGVGGSGSGSGGGSGGGSSGSSGSSSGAGSSGTSSSGGSSSSSGSGPGPCTCGSGTLAYPTNISCGTVQLLGLGLACSGPSQGFKDNGPPCGQAATLTTCSAPVLNLNVLCVGSPGPTATQQCQ